MESTRITQHTFPVKVDLSLVSGIWKTETDDNGKEYHVRHTADFDPGNSSVKRQDSYKL